MKLLIALSILLSSVSWAIPVPKGPSLSHDHLQQISLNGKNIRETRTLTNAYKFFVVLEITKTGDFGYCAGAVIESRFILTAAHCIHDATKVDVYYYYYDSANRLRYTKGKTQAHLALPNWHGGVDMSRPISSRDRQKIIDIGLVMVAGVPTTSEPVTVALSETARNGGAVAYFFGMDSQLPKPYFSGERITGLSLNPFGPNGTSSMFTGAIPQILPRKRSGVCKGDSGSPVVIVEDSQVMLLGVIHGGSLVDDTTIDLDDPRSERMSEKMCADGGHFSNISMHLDDLARLKNNLIALPPSSLRK